MKTHHTKLEACPDCGFEMDAMTGIGTERGPVPGDVLMCQLCTALFTVDEKGNRCPFTEEQIQRFLGDAPLVAQVKRAAGALHFMKHARS